MRLDKNDVIVAGMVLAFLLAVTAAIAATLINTSNNTYRMYDDCIAAGGSPADCRTSINNWQS